MCAPKHLSFGFLVGVALSVALATPSHADVVFNFDASSPINSFTAAVAIVNPNFSVDPAATTNGITSLNFSIQTDQIQNFSPVIAPNATIGAASIIEQNGNFFFAQARAPFPGDGIWVTVSATGLTAGDYIFFNPSGSSVVDAKGNMVAPGSFDGAFNPDFSTSGAPIVFGTGGTFAFTCGSGGAVNLACPFLLEESTNRQDMTYTINDPITFTDIDFSDLSDYTIIDTVTSSDPAGAVNVSVGVPEPDSLAVFIAALMALVGVGRFAPPSLRSSAAR